MIINKSGQSIGAQMINASTGAGYIGGTVIVYITIDAGTQTIGSVNGGICTSEGNGYYTYLPTAAETNGSLIAYTFVASGAVPVTVQVATVSQQQQTALGATSGVGAILVSDLITQALRRINVIQEGQAPTAAAMQDSFDRFNDFIDSVCANDELLIYTISRTVWNLSSSKGTLAN